ncbi:hypothetical protein D3C78_1047160 [compost metagenome]
MLLGEVEVVLAEAFRIQPRIDVALEGEQGLLGVLGGECGRPLGKARGVEAGELVGEMHQLGDLRRGQFAQLGDQLGGVLEVLGQGVARGHRRGGVVERLGGGNHHQHCGSPLAVRRF